MNKFILKNKYGFTDKEIELYSYSGKNIEENYISAEVYKSIRKYFENDSWNSVLHNKWLTANYFSGIETIHQPEIYGLLHPKSGTDLNGNSLKSFNDLIKTLKRVGGNKFVIKHIGGGKGQSVFIINNVNNNGTSVSLELIDGNIINEDNFDTILNSKQGKLQGYIVQERINTHEKLNNITSGGLSSIRIMTMRKVSGKCIPKKAFIRFGINKGATDHESNGGLMASINIDTGKIGLGLTKMDYKPHLKNHTDTYAQFYDIKVPYWNEAKKLTIDAASHIHGTNWIGWDVVIGIDKPYLIEGNVGGGLTTSQKVLGGFIENGVLEDWIKHFKVPSIDEKRGISFESWKERYVRSSLRKLIRR